MCLCLPLSDAVSYGNRLDSCLMPLDFDPPFAPTVCWGARMIVLSTLRCSQSIWPLASACCCSASHTRCQTPAFTQRYNRLATVRQGPYRSCSQMPPNPSENQTVLVCWTADAWLLWRQQGIPLLPLLIHELSSSHTPGSRLFPFGKQALAFSK